MYYYAIVDGKDGDWRVRVPDLKDFLSTGRTVETAITNATREISEWATDLVAKGLIISPPRDLMSLVEDSEVAFDSATQSMVLIPLVIIRGRVVKANISLDAGSLTSIDNEAKRRGLTRSAFIVDAALQRIFGQT